ncbi:MAG: DUF3427 domain-containing protein [Acidobacteria bacterium]|nr:DUF3427 domain-containing protein [Acidobacteriota bacterium]
MLEFDQGGEYTRADVKELVGLSRSAKGGPWDTGIVEHDGEFLIFANVGTAGRTGHDYDNRWEGNGFRWSHKASSRLSWPSVERLLRPESTVHLFWRSSSTGRFIYAGRVQARESSDGPPVEVTWAVIDLRDGGGFFRGPDEVSSREHWEGAVRQVTVNVYERDRAARQACIDHYGDACTACGLRLGERYGPLGADYIHVHHIVPLSELGQDYKVDPVKDLRPVCPNCHAMIHRRNPPLSVEAVRLLLQG